MPLAVARPQLLCRLEEKRSNVDARESLFSLVKEIESGVLNVRFARFVSALSLAAADGNNHKRNMTGITPERPTFYKTFQSSYQHSGSTWAIDMVPSEHI